MGTPAVQTLWLLCARLAAFATPLQYFPAKASWVSPCDPQTTHRQQRLILRDALRSAAFVKYPEVGVWPRYLEKIEKMDPIIVTNITRTPKDREQAAQIMRFRRQESNEV